MNEADKERNWGKLSQWRRDLSLNLSHKALRAAVDMLPARLALDLARALVADLSTASIAEAAPPVPREEDEEPDTLVNERTETLRPAEYAAIVDRDA